MSQGDLLHVVTADDIGDSRRRMGKLLIWGSFAVMVAAFAYCALAQRGALGLDLENWRPALYGYLLWATCLCIAQVVLKGEQGSETARSDPRHDHRKRPPPASRAARVRQWRRRSPGEA